MHISWSINIFLRTPIELIKILSLLEYSEIKENSRKYHIRLFQNINYIVYSLCIPVILENIINVQVSLTNIWLIYKLFELILSLIGAFIFSKEEDFSPQKFFEQLEFCNSLCGCLSSTICISCSIEEFSNGREVPRIKV